MPAMLQHTMLDVIVVTVNNDIPQSVCDVVTVTGHWESLADKEEDSCPCSAVAIKIYD